MLCPCYQDPSENSDKVNLTSHETKSPAKTLIKTLWKASCIMPKLEIEDRIIFNAVLKGTFQLPLLLLHRAPPDNTS